LEAGLRHRQVFGNYLRINFPADLCDFASIGLEDEVVPQAVLLSPSSTQISNIEDVLQTLANNFQSVVQLLLPLISRL
jgi:hypothetical protein